ncbi:MAG: hypothetical protein GY898_23670, partial [Proteobacteria bacterium]|nr:hypothetical protein [Pseudomonadota bacterium]
MRADLQREARAGPSGQDAEPCTNAALLRTTLAMQAKARAERLLPKGRWINPLLWIKVWRDRVIDLLVGWL